MFPYTTSEFQSQWATGNILYLYWQLVTLDLIRKCFVSKRRNIGKTFTTHKRPITTKQTRYCKNIVKTYNAIVRYGRKLCSLVNQSCYSLVFLWSAVPLCIVTVFMGWQWLPATRCGFHTHTHIWSAYICYAVQYVTRVSMYDPCYLTRYTSMTDKMYFFHHKIVTRDIKFIFNNFKTAYWMKECCYCVIYSERGSNFFYSKCIMGRKKKTHYKRFTVSRNARLILGLVCRQNY